MKEKYEREINLYDMFLSWPERWRSLIVFVVIGLLYALAVLWIQNDGGAEEVPVVKTDQSAEDLRTKLSEADALRVERLADIRDEFNLVEKEYEDNKGEMTVDERIQSLYYLQSINYSLDHEVNVITTSYLTEDQQKYYYALTGEDTDVVVVEPKVQSTSVKSKIRKCILIVIVFIFLHFVYSIVSYIFDKRIKHSDDMYAIFGIPEFTRVIEWTNLDKKKGIDGIVNKLRYRGTRRTEADDVLNINVSSISDKMQRKGYRSVALVGPGLTEERERIIAEIKNKEVSYSVKSIDSITHSVNGADEIAETDAAVIVVREGDTRYGDFMEEMKALKDRDISVMGAIVYEG